MAPAAAPRLSILIGQFIRGEDIAAASFTALSDLDHGDGEQLLAAWPGIPLGVRLSLMVRAAELAEDNVDLDFTQLAMVGLRDESAEVRQQAAEALVEAPQRAVAARLLAVLREDPDPDVRAAAADSLRQFVILRECGQFDTYSGDEIVEALRRAYEEPGAPARLRAAALESLGARSLPWVGEFLAESYNDDAREVRLASVRAMGDSAEEQWLDYLFEQLHSDDAEFRYTAVLSCGMVASEDAIEPLTPLLADEDSEVVLAAIAALGEIGGDDALDVLREYAESAPPELADVVAAAIEMAAEFSAGRMEYDAGEDEFEE